MADDIQLSEEEEAAIDAVWERVPPKQAKETASKNPVGEKEAKISSGGPPARDQKES